ncbi:Crp/Fnr family transcriptional regulator [Flammeovirga sp. SubArs3]|uniref:Crp/Fnr family transcriptional regulator n=1 Tax=Flammeovirga sp. SubArs3 TaxID=2995316 RepID=UPI00248AE1F0|nr:Crp/Fnr family transcriptional regulator [Flammeovirga sp. SubArs3]
MKEAQLLEKIITSDLLPSKEKVFKRGELLQEVNSIANEVFVIIEGAVQVIFHDKEEYIIRLGYKNSIIAAIPAFFYDTPTNLSIEAIRTCRAKVIKKKDFDQIIETHPEFQKGLQYLLVDLIRQQSEREIDLLINSPKERIRRVMERSPQLFQEVPLKYIATYLRMSPETLSRILKS